MNITIYSSISISKSKTKSLEIKAVRRNQYATIFLFTDGSTASV